MRHNELYHHGIKGQKWGTRNGPPYPLNPKVHASVVKNKKDGSTRKDSEQKRSVKGIIDNYRNKYKSMSDEERAALRKRIMVGAGVAAGLAGGVALGKKIYNRKVLQGKALVEPAMQRRNIIANTYANKANSVNSQVNALNAERAGLFKERLVNQNAKLKLMKQKKGLLNSFNKYKADRNIASIDKRILKNDTNKEKLMESLNSTRSLLNAHNENVEAAKNAADVLRKRGIRNAVTTSAGLGLAGGYLGYKANQGLEIDDRVNRRLPSKKSRIEGLNNRLTASSTDSAVTRRTKAAYNSMSDAEFKRKYSVSKAEYARRVEKYGDPYMNAPLAKLGKRLSRRKRRR